MIASELFTWLLVTLPRRLKHFKQNIYEMFMLCLPNSRDPSSSLPFDLKATVLKYSVWRNFDLSLL